ncbi:MAG: DUF2283 domain-containing protein [Cyanobacteriota bacterium]|nr:DUF2283 domain-containing protein [Cyanobacteriota bacterium]
MKKIRYSSDVDALSIEISNEPIVYAEDEGQMILHFAEDGQLVSIEILDVTEFMKNSDGSEIFTTL